ncbi:MAG: hypothetical protein L0241_17795 [Planctomycetia bacterium]|nr:hypothetical protein [Planctomycetia bacterium]
MELDPRTHHRPIHFKAGAETAPQETLAERGLTLAAMGGAVCGALAGAGLGVEFGSAYPLLCGTLGTMLGSALTACGWSLLVLPVALFTRNETDHTRNHTAEPRSIPSMSSAGQHS